MCGFVGCYGIVDEKVKKAANLLFHRGPDSQKYVKGENWSVQFNRLSIIDLSQAGMQPFSYDGVDIFVNGEIYNYIELRNKFSNEFVCKTSSDIEILPYLYKKFGINFLNYINGMFSLVIIDNKKKKIYLVRDRFGKKPLFFFQKKNCLYFASEIKGLEEFIKFEIDKENLALNLIANLNIEPLTVFKNIESVLPGFAYEFKNKNLNKIRWYTPRFNYIKEINQNIKNKIVSHLDTSINYRLRSDVPIGVFLSGGLDSSYILSQAKKKYENLVALICIIKDKEKISGNFTDTVNQEKYCKEISCKYKKIIFNFDYLNKNFLKILSNYDLPIPGTGHFIFYALSEEAKKDGIKVILTGGGGDEISGGYPWQNKLNHIPSFLFNTYENKIFNKLRIIYNKIFFRKNSIFKKIYKFFQLLLDPYVYHIESHGSNVSFLMKDIYSSILKKMRKLYNNYIEISQGAFSKNNNNSIEFRNIFITLASQNYFFDISTMTNSVENRAPFLDYELVELMFSISKKVKNKGKLRSFYRNMLSENLPDYIINAKKSGPNLPIHYWLTVNKLEHKFNEYLLKNISYIRNYLSNDLAKNLTNNSLSSNDDKYIVRFRIFCMIVWIKIKIEKKFNNLNMSFIEIINS